jgi:hypothetical protein
MKSSTKWFVGLGIVALFAVFYFTGIFPQAGIGRSGNVWCDNFEFYCCQEVKVDSNPSISATVVASCPSTAEKCEVLGGGSGAWLYSGGLNCRVVQDISTLYIRQYRCDDQITLKSASSGGAFPMQISKGQSIFSDRATSISFRVYNTRLAYTGASSDAFAGIPVQGSQSCVWDLSLGKPADKNFNPLSLSYTVPPNDCILSKAGTQSLCGNIYDECSSDDDCNGYPINGNQVCTGNTLMTYRCLNKNGLPSGVSEVSGGKYVGQPTITPDPNKYSGTGKVCTVDQTLNHPVSCCPSSNICGTNAFCNPETFNCEPTIKCSVNSDCNTAPKCDFVNLVSEVPYCNAGSCDFKKKAVECCVDANCAVTQSCTNNVCKDLPNKVDVCPFGCCVDDPALSGYTKRACPSGQSCVNHACVAGGGCTSDTECDPAKECKDGECVLKNLNCSNKAFGLIIGSLGVKEDCGFWCQVGLAKPSPVNVCVYDYTGLIILVVALVIIVGLIMFGRKKKGGKRKSSLPVSDGSDFFKNKNFWRIASVVVLALLLIFYFKYIFWIAVGLLVALILDAIFLGGVVRKIFVR